MLRANAWHSRTDAISSVVVLIGVAGTMSKSFLRTPESLERETALGLLQEKPAWLIIDGEKGPHVLLRAADLASFLEAESSAASNAVDLMEIPGQRYDIAPVHLQATLQEALDILNSSNAHALYVQRQTAPGIHRVYGILTREMIESAYR